MRAIPRTDTRPGLFRTRREATGRLLLWCALGILSWAILIAAGYCAMQAVRGVELGSIPQRVAR